MNKIKLLFFLLLISTMFYVIPAALAPQSTGSLTFSVFVQPSERSEFMRYFSSRTAIFSTDFQESFDLGWDSDSTFKVVFDDIPEGTYHIVWMDKTSDWSISFSHDEIRVESGKHLKVNALIERASTFPEPE